MKVLYLDCFSGISGDMAVGALCDLGVKPSALEWELSKLEIGDFHMHFERAQRQHVEGMRFTIHEGATHTHGPEEGEGRAHTCDGHHEHGHVHAHDHDHGDEVGHAHAHSHEHEHKHEHEGEDEGEHAHDHAHSHEHEHEEKHEHSHEDEEGHGHEHPHEHGHGHHDHDHGHEHAHGRTHREIRELILASELSHFVKKHALSIFERIAIAEGKIHGMPKEDVAFHEVGALDSIADIICVCVGIEALAVEKIFVSALHDGSGWVETAHGKFPIPVPATLEILKGIPVGQIDEPHELITPTGAAIVAEFGASFGLMPRLKAETIGYGVGSRTLASRPNVLRAVLGELVPE
jgi:uncharacterized protein (DUF111 family)